MSILRFMFHTVIQMGVCYMQIQEKKKPGQYTAHQCNLG